MPVCLKINQTLPLWRAYSLYIDRESSDKINQDLPDFSYLKQRTASREAPVAQKIQLKLT